MGIFFFLSEALMNQLAPLFSMMRNLRGMLAVALLAVFMTSISFASSADHERALQAMEAGEIKPLVQILDLLKAQEPGRVLEVELEEKSDRWVYEIKMIQNQGRVREFKVDAKTGFIIKVKND
jgi:uncharacterized membrane protein YkoI